MRYIKPLIFGLGIVVFLPLSTFASGLLRVSVDSNGNEGNSFANPYSVTPDGRYVLFSSDASNLVPNDINGARDVFVRDTVNNITTVISVDDIGTFGDNYSQPAGITPDGRYVLFQSYATNLVANDTNGQADVFVRDTINNTTTRVSIDSSGNEGDSISYPTHISDDGMYILFDSLATNLVANDTNGQKDIFVRDTVNNITTRVNTDNSLNEANNQSYSYATTPDGRYILFSSHADNLVPNDTNGQQDTFVRDIINNTTTRISVDSSGNESDGASYPYSVTPDGRYVLFSSYGTNLVANDTNGQQDVFVRDTMNNITTMASLPNSGIVGAGYFEPMSITPDGRYVLYYSDANNLVDTDTNNQEDVFVRDMINNTTILISTDSMGNAGDGFSYAIGMSDDGRYILFYSDSSNLVANDTNGNEDVFVRDTVNNTTVLISEDGMGNIGNNGSEATAITPDGAYILFQSFADNLIQNDTNATLDAFLYTISQGKYIPTILSPVLGITTGNNSILVNGTGTMGNQIELIGSGVSYLTNIDGNGDWYVQLPPYVEGVYVVTATEKTPGGIVVGDTGYTAFIIDTIPSTVTTQVVSVDDNWNQGNGYSYFQKNSITPDGRYVLFTSYADNLVANDANGYGDVFVRDTVNNTTKLISVNNGGNGADNGSQAQSITPDGRYVLFMSFASDLVANDTNGQQDVFVRDTVNNTTVLITQNTNGTLSNNYSQAKSITPNGRYSYLIVMQIT